MAAGRTAICESLQGDTEIVSAVLSDANAEEITVKVISGQATGIDEIVNRQSSNSKWFDLQGRRVKEFGTRNSELKRGLYIQNGKKVVR